MFWLKVFGSGLRGFAFAPWCLVGNGGMDPYSSPDIIPKMGEWIPIVVQIEWDRIPNNSPNNPFPHSLLSTREFGSVVQGDGCKDLLRLSTSAYLEMGKLLGISLGHDLKPQKGFRV